MCKIYENFFFQCCAKSGLRLQKVVSLVVVLWRIGEYNMLNALY